MAGNSGGGKLQYVIVQGDEGGMTQVSFDTLSDVIRNWATPDSDIIALAKAELGDAVFLDSGAVCFVLNANVRGK